MMMPVPGSMTVVRRIATPACFLLSAFGCLLLEVRPVMAQAGNSALPFLGLGAGARAAALSGAVSGWIGDATSAYWNPAALSRLEGWDIAGTHTEWLSDIRYEQVSLARNVGQNGFGLSFGTAYASDFDARDEVGNQEVSFGFSDLSLGVSYARAFSEKFSLGLTGKYLRESIDDVSADAFAADIGATWATPINGLEAGASLRNLGGKIQFDLADAGEFDLPQTVQVGLAWTKPVSSLSGSLLFAGDFISEKNSDPSLRFGAQYRYREGLSLLAGYRADFLPNVANAADNEQLDQSQDFSFGAAYDGSFRFEYAYVPFKSDLGTTHRISIGKGW
ncbi:MAG: PorV/PorQ family protein [Candidatus Eisenbacteria bacterium]|nr:PorV/PorQ family protein [Candidatus Eisenbacteria bacterium]